MQLFMYMGEREPGNDTIAKGELFFLYHLGKELIFLKCFLLLSLVHSDIDAIGQVRLDVLASARHVRLANRKRVCQ